MAGSGADNATAAWERLVVSAVLGTERATAASPAKAVAEALPEPTDPQHAMLHEAAALTVFLEAGRQPPQVRSRLTPANRDDRRPLRDAARRRLSLILDDRVVHLPEWLHAAAAGGWSVSPEHLPALLDWASQRRESPAIPALREVIGVRGRWLAEKHADWRWLVAAGDAEDLAKAWETGTRDERLAIVRRLRTGAPAKARELVESTWDTDAPDDRVMFLEQFVAGLSDGDEAFLERSLDDRRKPVRVAAADLLSRLPGSAFAQRMSERAAGVLTLNRSKSGVLRREKVTLSTDLPSEVDKMWARDGLDASKREGLGEKATLLMQVIAATPLAHWTRGGGEIEAWLAAATSSEWTDPALMGWTRATVRQRDAAWAKALLEGFAAHTQVVSETPKLLAVLPPPDREALVERSIDSGSPLALNMARACDHAWSERFSRAVLELLRKRLPSENIYAFNSHAAMMRDEIGCRLSPRVVEEAGRDWPKAKDERAQDALDRVVTTLVDTLTFRGQMLEELKP